MVQPAVLEVPSLGNHGAIVLPLRAAETAEDGQTLVVIEQCCWRRRETPTYLVCVGHMLTREALCMVAMR
jgi:hypothetical protein